MVVHNRFDRLIFWYGRHGGELFASARAQLVVVTARSTAQHNFKVCPVLVSVHGKYVIRGAPHRARVRLREIAGKLEGAKQCVRA